MRIRYWSSDVCSSDLMHGATPTGAERAAACWADARGVPQVAFRPDWNRHKKAAPFKRNERLIDAMPAGLVVFSGTGIQDKLGRATCRESVCQYVYVSVVAVILKKTQKQKET